MTTQNFLTKTKYMQGLQCHKRLWYDKNHPERASSLSEADRLLFARGREVGERAHGFFRKVYVSVLKLFQEP